MYASFLHEPPPPRLVDTDVEHPPHAERLSCQHRFGLVAIGVPGRVGTDSQHASQRLGLENRMRPVDAWQNLPELRGILRRRGQARHRMVDAVIRQLHRPGLRASVENPLDRVARVGGWDYRQQGSQGIV